MELFYKYYEYKLNKIEVSKEEKLCLIFYQIYLIEVVLVMNLK